VTDLFEDQYTTSLVGEVVWVLNALSIIDNQHLKTIDEISLRFCDDCGASNELCVCHEIENYRSHREYDDGASFEDDY